MVNAKDKPAEYELIMPLTYKDGLLKGQLLDPNYTNFILVDNAKQNFFGGEVELRAQLEAELAQGDKTTRNIPVVLVVIEGGQITIDCVQKSVTKKIPCLFIAV
jgi:hypothetical protein